MEDFGFGLTLNDGVSGVAKKAADALRQVESQANKAQSALSGKFADSWSKIGMAAERSAQKQKDSFANVWQKIGFSAEKASKKQQDSFANAWSKIGTTASRTQDRLHKQAEKAAERLADKQKEHSMLGGIKEAVGFDKVASAAFVGATLAEAFIKGAELAVDVLKEGIAKAFEAVETAGKEQSLRLGYRLTLGETGGKEALEDIDRFKGQTAFSGSQIAEMMQPIFEAGARGKAARSDFSLASDIAAARGKGADQGTVSGIVEQIEHIRLKGGISEKQLASLKIQNAPDFFKSLGKSMGIGADAAKKAASSGKVDPQLLINELIKATEERQGGKLGTGGDLAGASFEGRMNKLRQLPEEFMRKLVDSKGFDTITEKLGDALKMLDPDSENGQRIVGSLMRAMDKVGEALSSALTPENIDAFIGGVQSAVSAVTTLVQGLTAAINLIVKAHDLVVGDKESRLEQVRSSVESMRQTYGDIRAKSYENEKLADLSPEDRTAYAQLKAGKKAGGNTTSVSVTNHITVHGTDEETGKKAADGIASHTGNAMERAAARSGG